MAYRDTVLASNPASYWRLGVPAAAATGYAVTDGLVMGEGATVDGLQGDWQDWTGGSVVNHSYETGSRSNPGSTGIIDLTVGAYGCQWAPTVGLSDVQFTLHSDAGVDWNAGGYTHLSFWVKWDGTGTTPSLDVYLNYLAAGFTTRISVTTAATNIYPFPKNNQLMWRYDVTLTGAATLGSLGTFGLTAGSVIHEVQFQVVGLSPSSPFYIDEIQVVRTRAAVNSMNITDTTEIAQTYNYVPNHMVLLTKPSPPNWNNGAGSIDEANPPNRAYWDALDGNCSADATYTILKWAAQKWGFGTIAPIVRGGSDDNRALNIIDLLAAISAKESSWRQDMHSDWEQWWRPSDGTIFAPWCDTTFGIGQVKAKFHPPYPHSRLGTAWGSELHAVTIRTHYAGLGSGAGAPFPTTNNLRRSVGAWYFGTNAGSTKGTASTYDNTDIAYSAYVCEILGGTVNEPSQYDHGRTYDPTNAAATYPSYMAMRQWENAATNAPYWTY